MIDIISEDYRLPLIILLIITLLPFAFVESSAKKRSSYKRDAVKKQAIELIRTNSENLCNLVGIEPNLSDTLDFADNDAEIGEIGEDIEELEREDDITVDIEMFKTLWLSYVAEDEEDDITPSGIKKTVIMDEVMDWLGTRYRFGGLSKDGIDCSGFVRTVYLNTCDVMIPRTARSQYLIGDEISRRNLEFGDLVFFHTRNRVYVSHVGIYLGDNLFVHSSSKYGVTVSSLESTYYNKRFIGARRITVEDLRRFSINQDFEHNNTHQ